MTTCVQRDSCGTVSLDIVTFGAPGTFFSSHVLTQRHFRWSWCLVCLIDNQRVLRRPATVAGTQVLKRICASRETKPRRIGTWIGSCRSRFLQHVC